MRSASHFVVEAGNEDLPFASFSLPMISTSAKSGFGAAPPYMPECRSVIAPWLRVRCKPVRAGRRTEWEDRAQTVRCRRPARNRPSVVALLRMYSHGFAADFFFAFEDDLHVDGQLAAVGLEEDSKAFTCIQSWPLSSTAPRA